MALLPRCYSLGGFYVIWAQSRWELKTVSQEPIGIHQSNGLCASGIPRFVETPLVYSWMLFLICYGVCLFVLWQSAFLWLGGVLGLVQLSSGYSLGCQPTTVFLIYKLGFFPPSLGDSCRGISSNWGRSTALLLLVFCKRFFLRKLVGVGRNLWHAIACRHC